MSILNEFEKSRHAAHEALKKKFQDEFLKLLQMQAEMGYSNHAMRANALLEEDVAWLRGMGYTVDNWEKGSQMYCVISWGATRAPPPPARASVDSGPMFSVSPPKPSNP